MTSVPFEDNKPRTIDPRSHHPNPAGPERVNVKDFLTQLIIDYAMACPWGFVRIHPVCSKTDRGILKGFKFTITA